MLAGSSRLGDGFRKADLDTLSAGIRSRNKRNSLEVEHPQGQGDGLISAPAVRLASHCQRNLQRRTGQRQ